ncbi:MAG: helix-turn-helix transcriptional regulator [Lachnospiraceae bacterium]|nr:helix-turn-helix transcriptional regulator [Lachnospiraceae bacterium]
MVSGLNKRLHISRINSDLSKKQVAEIIGVSESTMGLYESGNRQPSLGSLIKLASLYKVSTDYLLGCEPPEAESISLQGLNSDQKKVVTLVIKCFKNPI